MQPFGKLRPTAPRKFHFTWKTGRKTYRRWLAASAGSRERQTLIYGPGQAWQGSPSGQRQLRVEGDITRRHDITTELVMYITDKISWTGAQFAYPQLM